MSLDLKVPLFSLFVVRVVMIFSQGNFLHRGVNSGLFKCVFYHEYKTFPNKEGLRWIMGGRDFISFNIPSVIIETCFIAC